MAPRILTLTLSPSLDASVTTERLRPEHKLRCTEAQLDAGGGGINVSRVALELGALTWAIFPQGGGTGAQLVAQLAERGVPAIGVSARARTRLCFNVNESATGQEYRFILPGAPLEPTELTACLNRVEEELPNADVLVASGSLPPGVPDDTYATLASRVRAKGKKLVLDTSGVALKKALGAGLFLVKPSRRELSEMLGEPLSDTRSLASACRRVHQSGAADILVVSMGGDGAILTSADGQWLGVPPRVDARSAVGAGDSFVAAITLSLLRGDDHKTALSWATAAGAAALLSPGTTPCALADVERLRPQARITRLE